MPTKKPGDEPTDSGDEWGQEEREFPDSLDAPRLDVVKAEGGRITSLKGPLDKETRRKMRENGADIEAARAALEESRNVVKEPIEVVKAAVSEVESATRRRRSPETVVSDYAAELARMIREGREGEVTREAQVYQQWLDPENTLTALEAVDKIMKGRRKREKESRRSRVVEGIGFVKGLMDEDDPRKEMDVYKPAEAYAKIGERSHPGYNEALKIACGWAGRAVDFGIRTEDADRGDGVYRWEKEYPPRASRKVAAEIGAGTGLATKKLAKHLQPGVNLAAVEVDHAAYQILNENVEEFEHVTTLRGDGEHIKFPEKGLHLGFMIFSLHHFGPIKAIKALQNLRESMEVALKDDSTWEPELYIIEECPSMQAPGSAEEAEDALINMHANFVARIWGESHRNEFSGELEEVSAADAVEDDERKSLKDGQFWVMVIESLIKEIGLEDCWPSTIRDWEYLEEALSQTRVPPLPESGEIKLSEHTLQTLFERAGFDVVERKNTTKNKVELPKGGGVMAFRLRIKGWEERQAAMKANLEEAS